MDPVGPWSAYAASYNRLANAGGFQNTQGDIHHISTGGGPVQASSTTSQLLFQAHANSGFAANTASPFNHNGFLSPPPVAYDAVFTPLFHQKAHYRPLKQTEAADSYNNMTAASNMFDQNSAAPISWSQTNQLPSPFGILPHESVAANSAVAKPYENFNHFTAQTFNPLNSQLDFKNSPFPDHKKRGPSPSKSNFYQHPDSNFKHVEYSKFQNGHLQQSCAAPVHSKDYKIPQPLPRNQCSQRIDRPKNFTPPATKLNHQKNQPSDRRTETASQSSPISFAMMDGQRSFPNHKIRSQQFHLNQQNYRYNSPENDYQRPKTTEAFSPISSAGDCVGVRRPSPLHGGSQQSPPQNTASPVYSLYNSPMTSISSPSPVHHQESCYNKTNDITPPIDASLPRHVGPYQSVITRNEKNFAENRYERADYKQWEERQRRYAGYDTQNFQRQQYSENSPQVMLQDLSSCRGDPMSLVKTLQQQQPDKSLEDKQKKIRKNSEKQDDYYSRVPPPAHHNGLQNQNGYYDYERWNIPPPPGKMFANPPVTFTPQPCMPANFVGNHQHQSLMVPPLPYFPAFHLPTQQPEIPPEPPKHVQPKIIVPNIEEELSFLAEDNFPEDSTKDKKMLGPNPKAGFMTSFLKFIQGEKDSSPPPNPRPIHRSSWIQSTTQLPGEQLQPIAPEFPSDPQDDPRYFPLPKTSEGRSFDSSHSEESDEEFAVDTNIDNLTDTNQQIEVEDRARGDEHDGDDEEEISQVVPVVLHKERKVKHKKRKKHDKKVKRKDTEPPRRYCAKRKAKDKLGNLNEHDENDEDVTEDSDSDPAWKPTTPRDHDDDPFSKKKSKRKQKKTAKRSRKNSSSYEEEPRNSFVYKNAQKKKPQAVVQPMATVESPLLPPSPIKSHAQFPFNVGEFVVLKNDFIFHNPPLWKVNEKAMLQKFTHFVKDGVLLYVDLPCFTGWSPESKNVYEGVSVKLVHQTKQEMVVQLETTGFQVITSGRDIIEASIKENARYQENFEVYLQTLFSLALDPTFLTDVFRDKDEYFLGNTKAIDSFAYGLLARLVGALEWPRTLIDTTARLPSYTISQVPSTNAKCICGLQGGVVFGLTLSGKPYHPDTLNCTDESISTLNTSLCSNCLQYFEVLHKICHQKCWIRAICANRVEEKRAEDFTKDTTVLLKELLADEAWVTKIFKDTRHFWGYVEKIIYDLKRIKKNKEYSAC